MLLRKTLLLCGVFIGMSVIAIAQRIYRSNSILATGNFYKIGVKETGIYKIDIPFLNKLGINTANLSSSAIQLHGNGGQMLSEANSGPWTDDLQENAIMIEDGG